MRVNITQNEVELLSKRFREAPKRCLDELVVGLKRVGDRVVATMRTAPWSGADALRVRTGALRRSFESRAYQWGPVCVLTVSTDVPYARLQEHGGTITPKSARALAIPLDAAKTAAGVPRFPGGPRTVPDLVLIQRKGRNPLLVRFDTTAKGQLKSMTPMFVLVPSVYVPPRLGFRFWFDKIVNNPNGPVRTEIRAAIKRMWREQ